MLITNATIDVMTSCNIRKILVVAISLYEYKAKRLKAMELIPSNIKRLP